MKTLFTEYCHRQLFDRYYLHPEDVNKDTILLPAWKVYLFKTVIRLNEGWRNRFHELKDWMKIRAIRYSKTED